MAVREGDAQGTIPALELRMAYPSRAGPGARFCSAPHPGDPFVIVDDRPVVRTISRSAEALLLADRGTDLGTHLDSLLVADDREARFDLVQLIELAAAGTPPTGDIGLSTVRPPEIRVRGRLTSCLRPAAAVLALAPARYPLPGSSEDPPAASNARRGASVLVGSHAAAARLASLGRAVARRRSASARSLCP
jgi:hypothetical protein